MILVLADHGLTTKLHYNRMKQERMLYSEQNNMKLTPLKFQPLVEGNKEKLFCCCCFGLQDETKKSLDIFSHIFYLSNRIIIEREKKNTCFK